LKGRAGGVSVSRQSRRDSGKMVNNELLLNREVNKSAVMSTPTNGQNQDPN
jgi:hypothetical protein